jgi:hypothetical protein
MATELPQQKPTSRPVGVKLRRLCVSCRRGGRQIGLQPRLGGGIATVRPALSAEWMWPNRHAARLADFRRIAAAVFVETFMSARKEKSLSTRIPNSSMKIDEDRWNDSDARLAFAIGGDENETSCPHNG